MNIVVFSGGTGTNSLTPCFDKLSILKNKELTYVLPISDNGGSTSEILRVIGGPAIGDIRSRIVRLINDKSIYKILSYRLSNDNVIAKQEWNSIVEGQHKIWIDIPIELKEIIRSFIINIQSELLKRNKFHNNYFNFAKASIGNLFLTSVRLFIGSLDASIELMMRLGRCNERLNIIPIINTNHTHHISAILQNNNVIIGQSQISHPSPILKITKPNIIINSIEDANPIYILPELKSSQLHFDKKTIENNNLSSPIKRILYINPYGEEIKPNGNPRAINKIQSCDMLVYSIGSVMTSLLPIIILNNIANSIYMTKNIKKVLLINNCYDRETNFFENGYDYVKFIINSMVDILHLNDGLTLEWDSFITDIVYLENGDIEIIPSNFIKHNIKCHSINNNIMENDSLYDVLNNL